MPTTAPEWLLVLRGLNWPAMMVFPVSRSIIHICISLLLVLSQPVMAADSLTEAGRTAVIDFLVDNAIANNLITGGVVMIGNRDGVLYSTARGRLYPADNSPLFSVNTVFDVASLTKVVATTPAVMKLLDEGRIGIMDPISRWFPELHGTGREDITILNLLTHTSGLNDIDLGRAEPSRSAILKAISRTKWQPPGSRFRYADINFILLGELVWRASGSRLDNYCRDNLFRPLLTHGTTFLPDVASSGSIAPTLDNNRMLVSGVVQDYNARLLGGVAGHAGLFSTARDLSRFARLMLGRGELDGQRIFSERVINQMTAPYFYSNGAVVRGLGWDIESPYSAPKGSFFSPMSFGHTGYSGTSIWIDPSRDLFVVLLTTRLNYSDNRSFRRLRSDISTLAAALFWKRPAGSDHH